MDNVIIMKIIVGLKDVKVMIKLNVINIDQIVILIIYVNRNRNVNVVMLK